MKKIKFDNYRLSKLDYVNIIEMSKDYLNKVKQFIEG